jgi:hypothetical protein
LIQLACHTSKSGFWGTGSRNRHQSCQICFVRQQRVSAIVYAAQRSPVKQRSAKG